VTFSSFINRQRYEGPENNSYFVSDRIRPNASIYILRIVKKGEYWPLVEDTMRNQRSQSNQTTANLTKFYKSAPRDTQEKGAPDEISELSESEMDWISRIYGNITETEESSYYRHWTNYYLLPRSISLANSRRCPGP
jgi:hypothetical protein